MTNFTIHADGGSRGNPGPSGAGAIIRDEIGETVTIVSKYLGVRTNNFAEYEAVILALEKLLKIVAKNHKDVKVDVKMDSELVVKQMKGEYKVRHPGLKEQYARLTPLAASFTTTFTHIPREQNKDADALANEAMDKAR